jgi:hypothetical protein
MNELIPRGYDLSMPSDVQAFIDDFRVQRAASVLKKLYAEWTHIETTVGGVDIDSLHTHPGEAASILVEAETDVPLFAVQDSSSQTPINVAVFEACCTVLERQLKPLEDTYLDEQDAHTSASYTIYNNEYTAQPGQQKSVAAQSQQVTSGAIVEVTGTEWELMSNYDIHKPGILPAEPSELVDAFVQMNLENDPSGASSQQNCYPNGYMGTKSVAIQHRERKRKQQQDKCERDWALASVKNLRQPTQADLIRVHKILKKLHQSESYQSYLNGSGSHANNIWIVKPAAKSRGRGITTFSDLGKLLKYVDAGTGWFQSVSP